MRELYTQTKVLHFHEKVEQVRTGVLSAPVHIRLKPMNPCNHTCWWCCYRTDDLLLSERMDEKDAIAPEKMREIVHDIVEMGVRAVTFSGGGEPLLYPHFSEAAEGLVRGGVKLAVLTNGSLLRGEKAEILGDGASWVRVSMDGMSAEDYVASRRVGAQEFDRIIANLGAFAKAKSDECELGVNLVVTRENAHQVFGFLDVMHDLGVNHVKVCEAVISTELDDNERYVDGFYATVSEAIGRARTDLCKNGFQVVDKMLVPGKTNGQGNLYQKRYTACPMVQVLTVIGADLNVYTCQDKAYTTDGLLGSIANRSFKEFWFSAENHRRLLAINPSVDCMHHCVAHEKNVLLGSYFAVDRDHIDFV